MHSPFFPYSIMAYLQKKCFVLDMDGTVYLGNIPIQGAVRFIIDHWDDLDFYFLSNNTSKGPGTYLKKLGSMGIPATRERILSPTEPLVEYLCAEGIDCAFLVGNRDYAETLARAMPELRFSATDAQAVILAYDTELTYEKLTVSAHLLQNPAVRYFATHPDLVCPDPAGPLPDVGSFIALFEKAVGRVPEKIFGKPDPYILSPLMNRYAREEMVMVGDRLSTDKKLAENAGIDFVLVLSGEARLEDLAHEAVQPWRVVEDLGEL
jgi:Predicted sugar phosphatases of the HAD superfamily